jgi:hypothetical protein
MADTKTLSKAELMATADGRRLLDLYKSLETAQREADTAEEDRRIVRGELEKQIKKMGNTYAIGVGIFAVIPDGTRKIVDPDEVRALEERFRESGQEELAEQVAAAFKESEYKGGFRFTPEEHIRDEMLS